MNIPTPTIVSKSPLPFPEPAATSYKYFMNHAEKTRAMVQKLGMAAVNTKPPRQPRTVGAENHRKREPKRRMRRNPLFGALTGGVSQPTAPLPQGTQ